LRKLNYAQAINEALHQLLAEDPSVFILGQGVDNPWYVGSTAKGLVERFGRKRVIDPPISENGMNGFAVGAALAGMRPILIHPRLDFLLQGVDPIINQASNWNYVFRGQISCPLVLWGIINRGGEQGAQHSQAIQAFFHHVPGLKVVAPATPYDAKGLLISAVRDQNPVVFIDDRWLYKQEGAVPEETYEVKFGSLEVMSEGTDVTIAATSYMTVLARDAAKTLAANGIKAEVLNLRSLKPFDEAGFLASIRKTGRLVVADGGWKTGGFAAEVCTRAAEKAFDSLLAPVARVTLPDAPAPSSSSEESAYYPTAQHIVDAASQLVRYKRTATPPLQRR
jgi:acetoin:2,6-dichlorophenolindophenol oxidoreductase subunit beta